MINRNDPLYPVLWPVRHWLTYRDWREVADGNSSELADRLLKSAIRMRYIDGLCQGGTVGFLFCYLSRGAPLGDTYNLAWAAVCASVLAFCIPGSIKRHRTVMAAVARLRSGASEPA